MVPMLVVIGSGPGIGVSVAKLFSQKRYDKIALIARDAERIQNERNDVLHAAKAVGRQVDVRTWSVDITDTERLNQAFTEIDEFGDLETLFFNAALVRPSRLLEFPSEEILYDFQITTLACYNTALWAIPKLLRLASSNDVKAQPSFLVTTSLLTEHPIADFFCLSSVKASQKNMVTSFADEWEGSGIHIAYIVVGGQVSPENKLLNPSHIAERTWELFAQEKSKWTRNIDILET